MRHRIRSRTKIVQLDYLLALNQLIIYYWNIGRRYCYLVLALLFVKVSWPEDSEEIFFVFKSSFHLLLQFNQSKVEAILLCPLRTTQQTNKLADLSSHYTFNADPNQGSCEH